MENNPNQKENQTLENRTEALLKQGRIKDALTLLNRNASGLHPLPQRLENIESTYSLLTKYFLDGVPDASRDTMLSDINLQLLDTACRIDRLHRIPTDTGIYYATARMISYRPRSLNSLLKEYGEFAEKVFLKEQLGIHDIQEMKRREDLLESIFNYVWTLGYDAKGDLKTIRDVVLSYEQKDRELSFQVLSALMLASLEWYDREKLATILSIYEAAATETLAARSLTALILVLARYRNRISPDKSLMARLETLKDSLLTYRRLRESVRSLIRTRDTDRVVTKMQAEVLPGMMKLSPDLIKKMKEISQEGDLDALEENPEWEEMMNKSGLTEKMRDLTEMQLEGADVMMVAFSNLKSFPFFSRLSNWFMPFTTNLSLIAGSRASELLSESEGITQLLESDGIICDSDKYSFLFALASMPAIQSQTMAMQLNEHRKQLNEAGMGAPRSDRPEYDIEVEKYIRDIYRFFKLYPKKNEFNDPFLHPIDFRNLPIVSEILNEKEILELFASFYFKRGYYREALPMLRQLTESKGDDPHIWEKLGVAIEQTGESIDEALSCYMKAELLSPDSRWLSKRIGKAYAAAGKWALAEEYLTKAVNESESIGDIIELAEVKRLAGNIEGAAKDFYKAIYLDPDNMSLRLSLAKLEMERGDLDKALKYATPLNEDMLDDHHNRMIGHIYFLKKEFGNAAKYYAKTIHAEHKHREWKRMILEDWQILESLGGNRTEMNLLLDSLI